MVSTSLALPLSSALLVPSSPQHLCHIPYARPSRMSTYSLTSLLLSCLHLLTSPACTYHKSRSHVPTTPLIRTSACYLAVSWATHASYISLIRSSPMLYPVEPYAQCILEAHLDSMEGKNAKLTIVHGAGTSKNCKLVVRNNCQVEAVFSSV